MADSISQETHTACALQFLLQPLPCSSAPDAQGLPPALGSTAFGPSVVIARLHLPVEARFKTRERTTSNLKSSLHLRFNKLNVMILDQVLARRMLASSSCGSGCMAVRPSTKVKKHRFAGWSEWSEPAAKPSNSGTDVAARAQRVASSNLQLASRVDT